nr:AAA family ATPase [uncultured Tolumonas sp.]
MTSNDYLLLPTQTQLVSRVKQLIGFSSSFIFLSGAKGSGRSSICQQLLNELDANLTVGYVELHPAMELSHVRENIVLQLRPSAVFDATEPLNETLNRLISDFSRPRLLVVDNADSLASDWAFELWQWLAQVDELYPSHKISVLLIGTSEFSEYLAQHLKGREQMAQEIEVEPLTLKEQKKLLMHYLQDGEVSAAQGEQALARLAHSQGKPGEVVAIAEACMDKKSLSFGKTVLPVNKIVAAVAILAGVVLLLSWVIPSLSGKNSSSTSTSTSNTQPERQSVALAPSTSAAVVPTGVVAASSALPAAVTQEGIVSGANGAGIDAEQAADDSNKRRVVISDQALQQITANQPAAEPAVIDSQATTSSDITSAHQLKPIVNEIKGDSTSVVQTESAKKKISAEKKPALEKKVVQKKTKLITEHKTEHKSVKNSPTTLKTVKNNTTPAPVATKGYALQLAASGDAAALKKLAASSGLQAKTKIYKNQSNGKYVLIYGEYASAAAAKAAVSRLPASVQNTKPWPKSYAQIRTEQGK